MTGSKKILVIDDDQAILRVFTRVLNRKGYDVATAETGNDARKKLESEVFDAALIDVRLPDVEGVDLLPFMQNKAPRMVKIVFTGLSMMASEFAERGADAFLIKPVTPEILLSVLDEKIAAKRISTNQSVGVAQ